MSDDIIIHPRRTSKEEEIPSFGLIFVNPGEAYAAVNNLVEDGGRRLSIHNSRLAVSAAADIFAAGPAIGAPNAVLLLEKLIILGAKRIVLMGWCGSLEPQCTIGDIVIPDGAMCGEGTSQYYSEEKRPKPSRVATNCIKEKCNMTHLPYRDGGRIWSTDAPYRESRKQLRSLYEQEKVIGVDMEFSALCTVAAFRGIDFGAALVVSDELFGERWRPGFKNDRFRNNCRLLIECLLG